MQGVMRFFITYFVRTVMQTYFFMVFIRSQIDEHRSIFMVYCNLIYAIIVNKIEYFLHFRKPFHIYELRYFIVFRERPYAIQIYESFLSKIKFVI